jgi:aminopeptidase N
LSRNNLTRDEASARAKLLRVAQYDVTLDLTGGSDRERTFRSRTLTHFVCRKPGASTFIELTAPKVHRIELNGKELDRDKVFDGDRIQLDGLQESNELIIEADCAYSHTGEGLHRFVDRVDGEVYLYTQFETYDAHRMYACFDQPDLKAIFSLHVIAPQEWLCVSNGRRVHTEDAGDGKTLWRFNDTPVLSTYITALVAGPYHEVRDRHDGIDLGLYCRKSLAEFLDPGEILEITKQGFDFFHRVFDYRYPFDKYDQLFVPEFNAGAMENAGCVTFLEDYVFRSHVTDARRERRAVTILHEMAHMWFGDLVTMRWWDDLWLNESFAEYASMLAQVSATRWKKAWTTFANTEKTWALRADQLPSTHPVVADAVDMEAVKTNFDGITYAKGASVLKQLVAWVGQEEFLSGLRSYFRQHEYSNTTLQDLLEALENASGRNLGTWSREWLETTGVNTLQPRFETDSSGLFTTFDIVQEAPAEHPTLRSHRLAVGLYDKAPSGELVRRERVELDVTGALTEVPKLLGARQPDLVLVNDDDLTYAKIRLDRRSLETLIESIADFQESLPRTLCWMAAWDMTRDAEMRARDYARLVLSGLRGETSISVVHSLLARAQLALTQYAEPSYTDQGLAELAGRLVELLRSARGEGPDDTAVARDNALAYAQALAATATEPEHVALVRGLLDGSVVVPGLTVDTDLRWTLLTRLVVVGEAGESEIEAEFARDSTATGEKRRATALASRPTAEAKEAAWRAVVDRDDLSNHLQIATMAGFNRYEHKALIRPYLDRYFASIGSIWEMRTFETAESISEMLFPALFVEQQTVDAVDRYLESSEVPSGLRRLLTESRDGIVRALRAREFDASGN